ncbi:uncharacterized protein LOC126824426 [Patella vulgata]|uniref:uncharacterized protein LOC126824426 n=1 Tax=Patella vulgata TaxID=6465 RepID=UPI00217FD42F|nr:uncharacterized protein LOC126824426 [Patella vulgata]
MRNTDMETIILCCLVLSTLAPDPSTVDNLQPTTPGAGPDNSYSITPYDPNNHNTTAGNKFNYVLRLKSQKEVEEIKIKTDIVALTQKNLSDWTLDELFHYFQVVQLIECNKQCIEETNIPVETLNISLMRRNGFECQPCYCDESCHVSGDCCTLATHTLPEQDKFQCIVTINQTKMEKSILTKMSCADNYHDKRIRELCKMPSSGCSMLPVTAQSGITYLNKYCAICNYESKYKEWQLDMRGENTILSSRVLELFSCEKEIYIKQSSFNQQMKTKTRECNRFMIQTCKINTSKILETNCQQHYGPIYRPDVGMLKNVFCYLCNGLDFRGEYIWVSNTEFGGFINRVSYPNLSDLFDRTYTSSVAGICNSSVDWFHPYQRRCYQIECSPQLQLQDGECLPIQNDVRTVYHILFTIDDVFYKAQIDLLANKIKEDLQTLRITTYVTYVGIQDYSNNAFIHVYFFLEESRFRNLTKILSFIKDNWKFGEQVTHDSTVSQSRSISHEIVSDDVLLTCCKKDKIAYFNLLRTRIVELNKQYICPHIVQDYLEFEDGLNGSLTLYNTSLTLNKGEYYMDQQNSVTICIDTINDKWKSSLYQENIIFIILRISFLVLSLLSLFLTFLTYCTFPILRTSASKNNMALVVCLFLGQLFLLIGSFQATNDIMCKITGMLIHYSWLCVVFWMNVCSFHMFSVFRLSTVSRIPSSSKRLIKYTLYANGLPLIIVAMVISSFSIIYGTPGYGGRKCYLETPLLVGVAFILPLALVIICNFIFLSLTIISINKTSNNARLVGKDQHHIMVYIKLSTLTGIFWTVDILSNFFLHDILSVLSTILNYGQGIFIFLSYMVNRRVANMWLGLCGKQLPLSSTESPKASNDSKQDKKQPVTEEVTLK